MNDESKMLTAYETAAEELNRWWATLKKHKAALAMCEEIHDELYPGSTNDYDDPLRVSYGHPSYTSLSGALMSLRTGDIKDALPILRRVRAAGYELKKHDDYEELGRRTYHFDNGTAKVKVSVFLTEENAKCRFEIVDVEVEEKPIYRIVCDDGEEVGDLTDEIGVPA